MALAATYTVIGPFSTSSTVLYTAPTGYQRDLDPHQRRYRCGLRGRFHCRDRRDGLQDRVGRVAWS